MNQETPVKRVTAADLNKTASRKVLHVPAPARETPESRTKARRRLERWLRANPGKTSQDAPRAIRERARA